MKKITTFFCGLAILCFLNMAQASSNTISIGYAQTKVQEFKDINGVNMKYYYEPNGRWGVISSLSYLSGSGDFFGPDQSSDTKYDDNLKFKYYSLLAGPAYRINNYFSVYIGAGVGRVKYNLVQNYRGPQDVYTEKSSYHKTTFAYNAGLQINPINNIALDITYEGSKFKDASLNGFNIGIGYRF